MGDQKKKDWTSKESKRLAETVFEKRNLFNLTIAIKTYSNAWEEVARTMNAQQTDVPQISRDQVSSKWYSIMKDFSTGKLKGLSQDTHI